MKTYNVTVNGNFYQVTIEEAGVAAAPVAPMAAPVATPAPVAAPAVAPAPAAAPAPVAAPAAPAAPAKQGATGSTVVKAPMQGTILKTCVNVGDSVKKGDVLLILEAMKMENEIKSPEDGVVASVECRAGDSVETDATLVSLN